MPDRKKAKTILLEAIGTVGPDRQGFLDRACGNDAMLRAEVESLLAAAEEAGEFLMSPTAGAPAALSDDPLRERPGATVDRYKLLQQIGEGGMGVVFMADQEHPVRRRVALKIIKPGMDSAQVIARFEAERQALAIMEHPNIARVFDGGATETGRPYFVMELVRGTPITSYCDQHKLAIPRRLELFVQVCQAVQHAHQKGLIHRDIKPSNVLVSAQDDRPMVKVIDFGIAKATQVRLTEKTVFTDFHQFIGTPEYMSPEQADGGLDVDTRSDVYSLGVLLYELLAGLPPFDPKELRSKAFGEMQRIIREVEPPAPGTRLSGHLDTLPSVAALRGVEPRKLQMLVRGELDWIVMRALEKNRTRRYDTASGLARDIERHLADEPVEACPPSARYRLQKFARRYRRALVLSGAFAAVLLAATIVSISLTVRAIRAEKLVNSQKNALIQERDRVVAAEADAEREKHSAQAAAAMAQNEARQSRVQYAGSLVSNADALMAAHELTSAFSRLADAESILKELGAPKGALDLSRVALYRNSPPPLWTAALAGGAPRAWTLLPVRRELLVAGGGADNQYHVLDVISGRELRSFGDSDYVKCMAGAETPDGPVVVVGGPHFTRIIDPSTGAVVREAADDRAIRACAISPDGKLAASSDADGSVIFWDIATLKRIVEGRHGNYVLKVAFSHDGSMVATSSDGQTIKLWDPHTGKSIRELHGIGTVFECLSFSYDDTKIFCGERWSGRIDTLPVSDEAGSFSTIHSGTVRSVLATPDNQRVIVSGSDGIVHVIDNSNTAEGYSGVELVNEKAARLEIGFVPDAGPRNCASTAGIPPGDQGVVIGVDHDGLVYAWPVVSPIRLTGQLYSGIAMTPDGLLSAGGVKDQPFIDVRDALSGRILRRLRTNGWSSANVLSPDGRFLYSSADYDLVLRAVDLLSGEVRWSVLAHHDGIESMALSPDGTILATGGHDAAVRIWSAKDGRLLRVLKGLGHIVEALLFEPDPAGASENGRPPTSGPRLLIGCGNTSLIFEWNLSPGGSARRVDIPGPVRGMAYLDANRIAVASNSHFISILDSHTLKVVRSLGPISGTSHLFMPIRPDDQSDGQWALSADGNELRVWDLISGNEQGILCNGDDFKDNTVAVSADGKIVFGRAARRINLRLPEQYRQLQADPSPVAQAAWDAQWGVWGFARALLLREELAGQKVPQLLLARADWMCGDIEGARKAFELAVDRHETPPWYAALCLSVSDDPKIIPAGAPASRPTDPIEPSPLAPPPAEGVLAAENVDDLNQLMGKEVTVEGVVYQSLWSKNGNHMDIFFSGREDNAPALICVISSANRRKFDDAFNSDASSAFSGARLRVRGTLGPYSGKHAEYKGWPQIELDDPAQVTVVK
jgi:serine/threonine protein kinase/WD40 repeat protein